MDIDREFRKLIEADDEQSKIIELTEVLKTVSSISSDLEKNNKRLRANLSIQLTLKYESEAEVKRLREVLKQVKQLFEKHFSDENDCVSLIEAYEELKKAV